MKFPLAALFCCLASGVQVHAATILHTIDPQLYLDEAALYPSVGTVTCGGLLGSGVLISDRWVLTAGHISFAKAGGTYRVGGMDYIIESVTPAPGRASGFDLGQDVGLLYLSAPVTGIQAAKLFHFETSAELLGREATWVGNGLTGTGQDDNRGTNQMRGFTNIIDRLSPLSTLPTPSFISDFDNPDGTSDTLPTGATATRLEGNVTGGDSGGGVFITEGGERYLVGINSYTSGFSPGINSKYGALSGAADLNFFHSWIATTTGIVAIPEPSTLWLCLLAASLGLVRRR